MGITCRYCAYCLDEALVLRLAAHETSEDKDKQDPFAEHHERIRKLDERKLESVS